MNISKEEFGKLLRSQIQVEYPFKASQLNKYSHILNWHHVSMNRNVDWSYELIKQFEAFWDWDLLQDNKSVKKKMTLGLLFPSKVKPPQCYCSFQYDICECDNPNWHNGNWESGVNVRDEFHEEVGFTTTEKILKILAYNIDDIFLEELIDY